MPLRLPLVDVRAVSPIAGSRVRQARAGAAPGGVLGAPAEQRGVEGGGETRDRHRFTAPVVMAVVSAGGTNVLRQACVEAGAIDFVFCFSTACQRSTSSL